jgi:hypothetical protein
VQHRVTIRANWSQVSDGVDDIALAYLSQPNDVVYVDESLTNDSEDLLKVEVADKASCPVVLN